MKKETLKELLFELLKKGKEGAYWDFKQEWHSEISDLLKDIICFTNTVHDKDCYIFFGVNNSLKIVGMTKSRRKQADIIDAMDKLAFATVHVPCFSVETINVCGFELDVLMIYNTDKTPVFLKKPYGKMLAGCVYARIEDRNTPDNGNAEEEQIEFLWKKRFGLTKPSLHFILDHLANKYEWNKESEYEYYNIYRPEYVLRIREDEICSGDEFYGYVQTNEKMSFELLDIIANNTVVSTTQIDILDSGCLTVPVPEWRFIHRDNNRDSLSYKCYVEGTDTIKILNFLYNPNIVEQKHAFSLHIEVVLLYHSEQERSAFETYISNHIVDIDKYVEDHKNEVVIYTESDKKTEIYKEQILVGKCLNQMLIRFREKRG